MLIISTLLHYLMQQFHLEPTTTTTYWDMRQNIISIEKSMELGFDLKLTDREKEVNNIFKRLKKDEYDCDEFLAARRFHDAKEDVEDSEVFKFIKHIPKGALLHVHHLGMASLDFYHNLTYMENLYICKQGKQGKHDISYRFFQTPDKTCNWKLLKSERGAHYAEGDVRRSLQIFEGEDEHDYFKLLARIVPLVTYRPAFEAYIYHSLELLYQDNIIYAEIRGNLPELYDLTGKTYSSRDTLALYLDVVGRFKRTHVDFIGVKLIYAPSRNVDNVTMAANIKIAEELKKAYPDFIAGFDLTDSEELEMHLVDFIEQLKAMQMPAFFHAGETNWYGTSVDRNLIDAVLLGTRRIGNGYGIVKHPKVLEMAKDNKIPVEICPISNQIEGLVADLRNHPGTFLIGRNFPIVVGSDDPGFWGASGLSYDWYYTIMALASADGDLKVLKQLALNSIEYSAMGEALKKEALKVWNAQWNLFLDKILSLKWL